MKNKISIVPAGQKDIPAVREMFQEYAEWMDYQICFESFDSEIANLPGEYAPPDGFILLANVNHTPAGIVALKKKSVQSCEMKRLWVKKEYRNVKIGYLLVADAINRAKNLSYKKIFLETTARMDKAIQIYNKFGFSIDNLKNEIIIMSKIIS